MQIDVKKPMLEIKVNVETRCNWQQPFPGTVSSVSLAVRAWKRRCLVYLQAFL